MTKSHRELQHLMEKVYRERGFDFREYKETTLTRRLERRLHAQGVKTYADYARVLDKEPAEYDSLFNDLTIKVTSFFRDEVAFKALDKIVLPALIKRHRGSPRILRIWSAGCATGEEPCSIAMLLLEKFGKKISPQNVTILATDIDNKALQRAKEGIFPNSEVESIRAAWRRKYFVSEDGNFRMRPALIKHLITFKVHNLVSDPPYQDLDLVVCRNVLIYFSLPLQMRVVRDFYDGLKRGGFLLLGKAEVPMGEGTVLFECLDRKAKLFKKADLHKFREERKEKEEPGNKASCIIYHGKTYKKI